MIKLVTTDTQMIWEVWTAHVPLVYASPHMVEEKLEPIIRQTLVSQLQT